MSKVHKNRFTALLQQASKSTGKRQSATSLSVYPIVRGGMLYLRINYGSDRLVRSLGIVCYPRAFDRATLTVKGNSEATLLLRSILTKVEQLFAEIRLTERPVNLEEIWGAMLGNYSFSNQTPTLYQLFDRFMETVQAQYEVGDIGKSSYGKLQGWDTLLKAFSRYKYGKQARIEQVVPADAKALDSFLKKTYTLSNNYVQKIIQHFKRILNYAVENEWIIRNPFLNFRRKFDMKKGEYLTEKELQLIESAPLFSPVLERIRDVFVFMCWTGLSYKDTQQLQAHHIVQTVDGDYYIIKNRQKTGTPSIVYLTDQCRLLLEKYKDDKFCLQRGQLLPIPANAKINAYLKQIAGITNIKKGVSCHTARRTFATLLHAKGVDESFIKSAMGHTSIAVTHRHYIHTQPDAIVKALKSKLAS